MELWNLLFDVFQVVKSQELEVINTLLIACVVEEIRQVDLVGAFNQEKALVGAFSMIVQLRRLIVCSTSQPTWVVATKQDTFDDHLHSEKTVSVGVMEFETIAVKI